MLLNKDELTDAFNHMRLMNTQSIDEAESKLEMSDDLINAKNSSGTGRKPMQDIC